MYFSRTLVESLKVWVVSWWNILGFGLFGRTSVKSETLTLIVKDEVDRIIDIVTTNYHIRTLSRKALTQAIEREDVSNDTIRRAMHKREYHKYKTCRHSFIEPVAATRRLFWIIIEDRYAQQLIYWLLWMWSDEVTFETSMQGTKYVIRTSEDRHNPNCAQNQFRSGRSSFTAWGMIGFY